MLRSLVSTYLPAAQILVSALLVAAILFQPSTAGVGGALGGADGAQNFHTKRGFEKFLFIATIVLGVLFAALCVLAIVLEQGVI
ncbi:MAG: preprotein translocase subunit SecG [Candidatus Pacebacteria bacterium]|nr:preprotein translocase subunit SecG [Candidatus Paceibacterota bacterium]